jgi:hypothetical protein
MSEQEATYERPEHGWTCFFCGETFKTPGLARAHFGGDPLSMAGCQIKAGEERMLLGALREAEKLLDDYRRECDPESKRYYEMQADHAAALRREEEEGYERGLADGRANLAHVTRERDEALARLAEADAVIVERGKVTYARDMPSRYLVWLDEALARHAARARRWSGDRDAGRLERLT